MVTGGSQGLGRAAAEALAKRGAAGLLLVGRDQAKGAAAAEAMTSDTCRAVFVSADLSTVEGCKRALQALDDEFGTCQALINCAALTARGTVWDTTAQLWDAMLGLNVRAAGLLSQGVARLMVRESTPGSIVLIGSVAGRGGPPRLLPYATSKGALVSMTKNLAFSLMRHHIRVNLLCPGWIDTPNEHIVQQLYDGAPADWLQRAEASAPFGRLIKPYEIALTIAHLATAESGMMTGAIIDWDQSVHGGGDVVFPGAELVEQPPISPGPLPTKGAWPPAQDSQNVS